MITRRMFNDNDHEYIRNHAGRGDVEQPVITRRMFNYDDNDSSWIRRHVGRWDVEQPVITRGMLFVMIMAVCKWKDMSEEGMWSNLFYWYIPEHHGAECIYLYTHTHTCTWTCTSTHPRTTVPNASTDTYILYLQLILVTDHCNWYLYWYILELHGAEGVHSYLWLILVFVRTRGLRYQTRTLILSNLYLYS